MTIVIAAPDGKRAFSIETNDPEVARRAVRQRLAQEDMLANQTGKADRPSAMDTTLTGIANGATLGLSNVLEGGAQAATTAVRNAIDRSQGKTPSFGAGDAYRATRAIQADRQDQALILSGVSELLGLACACRAWGRSPTSWRASWAPISRRDCSRMC